MKTKKLSDYTVDELEMELAKRKAGIKPGKDWLLRGR